MKKLIISLSIFLVATTARSQVKIIDLPNFGTTDASNTYVPITSSGTTYRVLGKHFAWHKLDSVTISNDSVYEWKRGTSTFRFKISSGSYEAAITAPYTTNKYWTGYKTYGSLPDSVRSFISLTTTGTSGAATYNSATGVFNIPQYGGGNVFKVGTPANNQLGVWTGDGTMEGVSGLTWDGSDFSVPGGIFASGGNSISTSGLLHGGYLELTEAGAIGVVPSGFGQFWIKNDGTAHFKNDAGVDIELGAAGSGLTAEQEARLFTLQTSANPTGTITHDQDLGGQHKITFTATGGRTLDFDNLITGDITLFQIDNTSGSDITLTLPSNSYVNYASAATATIPANKSSLSLSHYDGTNFWFIQSTSAGATLQDLTAGNSTLSFSGAYNGSTSRTVVLNLNNANTWTADQSMPDEAYDATNWNGSTEAPTKNAIRDKIESMGGGGGTPGGSSSQFQWNNGGSFAGSSNLIQRTDGIYIPGSSSSIRPLTIRTQAVTTTAAALEVQRGTDSLAMFRVDPAGGLQVFGNIGSRLNNGYAGSLELSYLNPNAGITAFNGGDGSWKTLNIAVLGVNFNASGTTRANYNSSGYWYFGSNTSATSNVEVGGSFATKYTSTATGITLDATHSTVDITATGQTITLPTAASITGRIYTIKLTASGSGTVATTSSQTIDGSTTYSLASQYKYVTVQSNGSNWIVIANN
jgi:hypothetical protein